MEGLLLEHMSMSHLLYMALQGRTLRTRVSFGSGHPFCFPLSHDSQILFFSKFSSLYGQTSYRGNVSIDRDTNRLFFPNTINRHVNYFYARMFALESFQTLCAPHP